MNTNKNNLLINDILESNLLYFKRSSYSKSSIQTNKSKYLILKVTYLLTAVKQFLRLCQFQLRVYKNGLQINLKGGFYQELITQLLKEFFFLPSKDFFVYGNMNHKTQIFKKLFLDLDITTKLSLKNIRWYNYKKIFVLIICNTWLKFFKTGVFQNYLKVNNYISILFLLMSIFQIISLYSVKKKINKKYAIKFKI